MEKSETRPPREWRTSDLQDLGKKSRADYRKALPVLILEEWLKGQKEEGVANFVWTEELRMRLRDSGLATFKPHGSGTLLGSLTRMQKSRNLTRPSFIEYQERGRFWLNLPRYEPLLQEYRRWYRDSYREDYKKLYPDAEPQWKVGEPPPQIPHDFQPELNAIFQVLEKYDKAWQKRLEESEAKRRYLQAESEAIRRKLEKGTSILDEVTDDELRDRIKPLLALEQLPSDTLVREASAVFEHRLRTAHDSDSTEYGVRLVGALLNPESGTLVLTQDANAQRGVMMLYEGALKFIRNPPMHGLVEYSETRVRIYIRMLDSLLQLLSEGERRIR